MEPQKLVGQEYLFHASLLLLELLGAYVVISYDPFHSRALCLGVGEEEVALCWRYYSSIVTNLNSLAIRTLKDPSPAVFIGAVSLLTLTELALQHLHRSDRYQNIVLIAGTLGAFSVACFQNIASINATPLSNFKPCLVLGILVSRWISVILHRWFGLGHNRNNVNTPSQDSPCKCAPSNSKEKDLMEN